MHPLLRLYVADDLLEADIVEEELRFEYLGVLLLECEFLAPEGVAQVEHHGLQVVVELARELLVDLGDLGGVDRLREAGDLRVTVERADLVVD